MVGPASWLGRAETRLPSSTTGLLVAAVPLAGLAIAFATGRSEQLAPTAWAGLALGAGMVRPSFRRDHLVWINRGSGGILVFSGVALLGSLLVQHFG